jgi:peptidoglycan/xylan/chitin deacetylase (PgdA/CDA1 family)
MDGDRSGQVSAGLAESPAGGVDRAPPPGRARSEGPGFGALVISLDFELHWGVRHMYDTAAPYRANLLGARVVVPRLLELFAERRVAATWATVGFLFASCRAELEAMRPAVLPHYADPRLNPYGQEVGESEEDDPLHYAASLLDRIAATPGQEIATHTLSHLFCLEPGVTREAFRADLECAVDVARKRGVAVRSIVFPRDQHNPEFDAALREMGITCYRGPQLAWMYRPAPKHGRAKRLARLLDAHLPLAGPHTVPWERIAGTGGGLRDVPASFLVRPHQPRTAMRALHFRRIAGAIRHAARAGEVVHIWWHPHNFGANTERNLEFLGGLLDVFAECRERWGMRSLGMADAAELAGSAVSA